VPRDKLAAVQVPREDEVVAGVAGSLPDTRVMSTEDTDLALVVRRSLRTGDGDHPPEMSDARDPVVNPLSASARHRLPDRVQADLAIVVAADGKHRRDFVEAGNQAAELAQFGALVYEVAAEQHHVGIATDHGLYDLAAQSAGPATAEMDVAHVQQPARVAPRRESLLADVEGVIQSDFQQSGSQRR
jgi:hypothetical protein